MKLKHPTLLAGAFMCAMCAFGDDAVRDITESAALDILESAYTEQHFRQMMITNMEGAVKALFTDGAAMKWRTFRESRFSDEQMRDFFVGSVQLRGPVSGSGSIVGFYNPWWDAILVAECHGAPVAVLSDDGRTEQVDIRKVGEFTFLSGEQFRCDSSPDIPSAESVLSKNHLLPMTVADLMTRTRHRFDDVYGSLTDLPLLANHPKMTADVNIRQIQTRSALRLKMASEFIHNAKAYKEAWEIAKVLRDGRQKTFDLLFSSDYAKMMSSFFVKLPRTVRAGFEPYCYYPSSDGSNVRLYVFVNVNNPRLFALAYLGTGWKKTVFEWFDFDRADGIVKAFKLVEEVRK